MLQPTHVFSKCVVHQKNNLHCCQKAILVYSKTPLGHYDTGNIRLSWKYEVFFLKNDHGIKTVARSSGPGQDHQGPELRGAQCPGMPWSCRGDHPASVRSTTERCGFPHHREQQSDSGNRIRASSKTRQMDLAGLPFWFCRSCSKQRPRGLHSYRIVLRLGVLENFLADGRAFSKRTCMTTTFCSWLHKGLYLSGPSASPSHSH